MWRRILLCSVNVLLHKWQRNVFLMPFAWKVATWNIIASRFSNNSLQFLPRDRHLTKKLGTVFPALPFAFTRFLVEWFAPCPSFWMPIAKSESISSATNNVSSRSSSVECVGNATDSSSSFFAATSQSDAFRFSTVEFGRGSVDCISQWVVLVMNAPLCLLNGNEVDTYDSASIKPTSKPFDDRSSIGRFGGWLSTRCTQFKYLEFPARFPSVSWGSASEILMCVAVPVHNSRKWLKSPILSKQRWMIVEGILSFFSTWKSWKLEWFSFNVHGRILHDSSIYLQSNIREQFKVWMVLHVGRHLSQRSTRAISVDANTSMEISSEYFERIESNRTFVEFFAKITWTWSYNGNIHVMMSEIVSSLNWSKMRRSNRDRCFTMLLVRLARAWIPDTIWQVIYWALSVMPITFTYSVQWMFRYSGN